MKTIDVCGLGNGLLDILMDVSEEDLSGLKLEKGSERLIEREAQESLLAGLRGREKRLRAGGSVANSVIAFSQLGGKGAFLTRLGNDEHGRLYQDEFEKLGIQAPQRFADGEATGTVAILVTPDGERTMRASLGAAQALSPEDMAPDLIGQSKWLFVEGYVFANSASSRRAIRQAIGCAKQSGCRVAITVSEDFIVHLHGPELREALLDCDLLFANEKEACALTGCDNLRQAFAALKDLTPSAVVTAGAEGALVRFEGQEQRVEAFPCKAVDLTGAGDMLSGTFLYGITHGLDPVMAARAGCYMAMRVITAWGPRLEGEIAQVWEDCKVQTGI